MGAAPAPNTDFVARRILALAGRPLTTQERGGLREALLRSRNADGGFGPGHGYASTAIDTALALRALRALGEAAGGEPTAAVRALAPLETPGGGFGATSGGPVSTLVTAEVVLALLDWPDVPEGQPLLARTLLTLAARRNPDGGFGESPSTAYGTALALRALSRARLPQSQLVPAITWLKAAQRPDRSFGGSRYATALTLTALRVALGGNLTVPRDSVSFTPVAPREGDRVRVTAAVRNTGNAPAEATHVRLYDGAPETGELLNEEAVPALAPGEAFTVELDFDTTDRPGVRSLYVAADGRHEIEEAREDDNTATLALSVEGLLADLQPASVVVEPSPATEGEAALVQVTVLNLGEKRNAAGAVVRLVLGNPRQGGRVVGDVAIPPIDAGSATTLSFTWDTTGALGESLLYAIADATYVVGESDESNNETAALVEVVAAPPPGAELSVPSFVPEPSVLSTVPQTMQLAIAVRNRGLTPVTDTRLVVRDTASGEVLVDLQVSVAARTTRPVVAPLTLETPGTRHLEAVVDPDGTVPEENEDDNRATAVIVDRQDTVDLEILATEIVPSSTDLLVGDVLTVTGTVHNRGTAPVVNVPVVLAREAGDGGGELARHVIASLDPGAAVAVALSWKTAAIGSPLALLVRVDPFGVLPEVSESNNDVPLAITVRPSSLPNLRVIGADIAIAPDPPLQGGSAVVSVRVTNPAVVEAPSNTLALYLGDPEDGGTSIGEQAVPLLAAGGQTTVEVPWPSVDLEDSPGLFAVADSGNDVPEYDETDNVAFRPVLAIGLPDLTIGMADVTLEPAFPHAGEPAEITARVHNLGERGSGAAVLRIPKARPGGCSWPSVRSRRWPWGRPPTSPRPGRPVGWGSAFSPWWPTPMAQ
jgi:subtilase family serine protease